MNHDPFDRLAEGYDEWYLRSPELFRAELGALLSLGLEGRGLDVGTGTGIFAGEAGTGICLDPSLPMLRKAVGRCDPVRGVAEGLPFAPSVFDYVMMTATLSFLPRPERAVREAHRVLRSGGFLALCIIPRDSEWGRLYMEKAKRGHPVYGDARFFTVAEARDLLDAAGFRLECMVSTLHGLEPSDEREGLGVDERGGFVCLKAVKV